jgi:cytochrome c-type biogenesis protein CcmF
MPWLLGTALIHSITVQERRRMLHAWNLFLVITTFALSLLGTFLVRSGVLSSVHAFAVDPGRGAYILLFMVVVLSLSFGIFLRKGRYQQAEENITSALSRESFFVWNNVVFTLAGACVLLGTLYPLALEALTAAKITVGPPYFNAVMVPIFLLAMLLMGIAPLVPWRKANADKLRRRLLLPATVGLTVAALTWGIFPRLYWTGPVALGLVGFVLGMLATDFIRAVKQRRGQLPREGRGFAIINTVLRNQRHYGGMVVHFGIMLIAVGLVGSGLFRLEKAVMMAPGDILEIGGERLRFDGVQQFRRDNYLAVQAQLTSLNSGYTLAPERRRYPVQEAPTTEASIHSTLLRDVYAVITEPDGGRWGVQIYVNPLVQFIWLGGMVIISGLGLSLGYRVRRMIRGPAAVPAPLS